MNNNRKTKIISFPKERKKNIIKKFKKLKRDMINLLSMESLPVINLKNRWGY
jgi:hypothetical protein